MVTAKMMQQLWAVVESTQVTTLLQFDDSALAQLLLSRIATQQPISAQAANSLNSYIESRLPLIRDIAEGRQAFGHDLS